MGVYIPNMKVPETCGKCLDVGWHYVFDCHIDECDTRMQSCPLVEVKPHGRLIEDTVLDNMSMWNTDREYDRGWDSAVQAAINRIKTAPTIIEAEGEDG